MANFDLKTITPLTSFTPSSAFLFGAANQSSGTPAPYTGTSVANGVFSLVSSDVTIASGGAATVGSIGGNAVTLGGSLTLSGAHTTALTITGTTAVTLPTAGTLLSSSATAQAISGGARVTSFNIGTVSSGTTTLDPGNCTLQYLSNNGAFTLAAPANDGAIILCVTNAGSAGTITFSGFSVGSNTGDAYDTTNGHVFMFYVARVNSISTYSIKACQ